jgi:uncharacterized membrane protein
MKFSTLLIINAIVGLVFGIGFLLVPAFVLTVYGVSSGLAVNLVAQFYGVELVAVGLLSWFARYEQDPSAQRPIILAFLISDVIGLIISLIGTLTGVLSAVGWSAVVIYLFFSLGFAYFQFMKPSTA